MYLQQQMLVSNLIKSYKIMKLTYITSLILYVQKLHILLQEMCCNLFHVLGIHLCEYVLTALPRNIGKVLNVFICCTWYLQEYRGICGFLLEKKMPLKYFDEISLNHNTKSWQPCIYNMSIYYNCFITQQKRLEKNKKQKNKKQQH